MCPKSLIISLSHINCLWIYSYFVNALITWNKLPCNNYWHYSIMITLWAYSKDISNQCTQQHLLSIVIPRSHVLCLYVAVFYTGAFIHIKADCLLCNCFPFGIKFVLCRGIYTVYICWKEYQKLEHVHMHEHWMAFAWVARGASIFGWEKIKYDSIWKQQDFYLYGHYLEIKHH